MVTQHGPTGQTSSATISDIAGAAQDRMSETVDQAQVVAQEQYDKLTRAIRRNPLQAAGIAAGIGFVIALVARR
jgi:ElaB/YqjD/DUF883 family membrane-anchored ribosome-binding protein